MNLPQIAGVLPAVVFPAATAFQLVRMLRAKSAAGVSVATWTLFGFANIGMYFYTQRYSEWQSILGMLVTALLDFVIVGLAIASAERSRAKQAYDEALDRVHARTRLPQYGSPKPVQAPRRPPYRPAAAGL